MEEVDRLEVRTMNRAKELMEEKGLDVKKLAIILDTTSACVRSYLENDYSPRIRFIIRLALALDVSADYLLGLSDERK